MRLPNVFTAMADVAMGFLFVQSADWQWDPWRDSWTLAHADGRLEPALHRRRGAERRVRPGDRPAASGPSGRCPRAGSRSRRRAGSAGSCWCSACCWAPGPGSSRAICGRASSPRCWPPCILLYDAWLKRTPLGPLAMGACRMLNVLLGMSAVDAPLAGRALARGRRHRRLRGRRHLVRPTRGRAKAAGCNWRLRRW